VICFHLGRNSKISIKYQHIYDRHNNTANAQFKNQYQVVVALDKPMPDCTSSEQKHNVKHSSRPVIFANPKPIPADDALLSRSPGKTIPAAPCSNTCSETRPAGRAITRLFPNTFHRDSTSFCSPTLSPPHLSPEVFFLQPSP
jgi:hypothetical protein